MSSVPEPVQRSIFCCSGEKLSLSESECGTRQRGARYSLWLLTGINLINFADRYVPAAVKDLMKEDLGLSDAETSLPATGMILVYMVFAVIFGYLADKEIVDRRHSLVFGIFFWSLATFLAGFAQDLAGLVLLRSLIGVGEAAYGTIAPPMLSDFYPIGDRNVVYGIYYLAIPVGSALGYGIGGIVGGSFGWRVAFFVCGIPGMILCFLIMGMNDPIRGVNDDQMQEPMTHPSASLVANDAQKAMGDHVESFNTKEYSDEASTEDEIFNPKPNIGNLSSSSKITFHLLYIESKEIMTNKFFLCSLAGVTANNFALGGLADWYTTYMYRYNGIPLEEAGLYVGAATVIGGILGNVLGAKVSKFFEPKIKSAYYLIPAIFTIPAVILLGIGVNIDMSGGETFVLLLIAQVFLWTFLAPQSAIVNDVIPPRLRARACGLLIFFQHILGDVISPPIIGLISDQTGSLRNGLQLTWITLLLSGLIWFLGYYFLDALPIATSQSMRTGSSYLEILCGYNSNVQNGPERKVSDSARNGDADFNINGNSNLFSEVVRSEGIMNIVNLEEEYHTGGLAMQTVGNKK